MILKCKSIDELPSIAEKIIGFGEGYNIWLLSGSMGAGKTTLTQALCNAMNSIDEVSSPTFALVNEYLTDQNDEIFHFDFYRLESEMEAIEIGCDEYFYSGSLCLIEWPEKIPSLIPPKNLEINIKLVDGNHREIHLIKND